MSNIDRLSYARQGKLFHAANVSVKSVIAVNVAMTGLILYNPIGSGKKLAVVGVGFSWTTAPAAVHNLGIGVIAPEVAAPTSLTAAGSGVQSADGSGARGIAAGYAYDAATFVAAPVARKWLGGAAYGSGVGESPYAGSWDIDGEILVAAGGAACLIGLTTTLLGVGSVSWIEVDE